MFNKKKKLAAKKKKQEQREKSEASLQCCDTNAGETQAQDTKTPQEKFDEELAWCISQLEIGLARQKPDKNTAQHTEHILKSLKSPKTALPKKRQIMFSVFGDYRKKIEEDKKTSPAKESQRPINVFSVKKNQQKSVFIRVSRQEKNVSESSLNSHLREETSPGTLSSTSWKFKPSSSNEFRFNFGES
ncbi:UPF0488 protein C8orf33 homolog [Actinia tenebrosa]|uniref:UPF0488 protein C8orf33 homolog n=1 Tax=Actinia tenebrosa TaxID=6105 RepID=A0A6P8HP47_ACTTE|nr:UPF0488 protein C8orf33 homolog [Actinia tenebrosa]